jgi:hypothetical protein
MIKMLMTKIREFITRGVMHTSVVSRMDMFLAGVLLAHGELVQVAGDVVRCSCVRVPRSVNIVSGPFSVVYQLLLVGVVVIEPFPASKNRVTSLLA